MTHGKFLCKCNSGNGKEVAKVMFQTCVQEFLNRRHRVFQGWDSLDQ